MVRNIFVLLTSLSLCVIILEFSLRKLIPAYDPSNRIRYISQNGINFGQKNVSLRHWNNRNEFNVAINFNRYGFRDKKDFKFAKEWDFFLVGDSFALGQGVDEEDRFSNLLEKYRVSVYNISIPNDFAGYEELIKLAQAQGANIKNLLVGICMENDIRIYEEAPEIHLRKNVPLSHLRIWLNQHSATYHVVNHAIQTSFLRKTGIRMGIFPAANDPNFIKKFEINKVDSMLESSLMRLLEIINPYNSIVIIIPSRLLWIEKFQEIERQVHNKFLKLLLKQKVNFVDLTPAFEREGDPLKYYYPIDGHWNRDGHRLAADEIADFFNANGWIGETLAKFENDSRKIKKN